MLPIAAAPSVPAPRAGAAGDENPTPQGGFDALLAGAREEVAATAAELAAAVAHAGAGSHRDAGGDGGSDLHADGNALPQEDAATAAGMASAGTPVDAAAAERAQADADGTAGVAPGVIAVAAGGGPVEVLAAVPPGAPPPGAASGAAVPAAALQDAGARTGAALPVPPAGAAAGIALDTASPAGTVEPAARPGGPVGAGTGVPVTIAPAAAGRAQATAEAPAPHAGVVDGEAGSAVASRATGPMQAGLSVQAGGGPDVSSAAALPPVRDVQGVPASASVTGGVAASGAAAGAPEGDALPVADAAPQAGRGGTPEGDALPVADEALQADRGGAPGQDSDSDHETSRTPAGSAGTAAPATLTADGYSPAVDASVRAPSDTGPSTLVRLSPGAPADVNAGRLGEALAGRILWLQAAQATRADIAIDPPALGGIEIQVEHAHGRVSVTFVAQQAATRDLLDAGMARLREMLAAEGVGIGSLDVRSGGAGADTGGHASRERQPPGAAPLHGLTLPVPAARASVQRLVDTWA
jgi:hypothetical protein